jgi:O-methyltransferase
MAMDSESLPGVKPVPAALLGSGQTLAVEALYAATCYVAEAQIDGDIVDCGRGETEDLTIIARTLLSLGESSRRLILFDTSMVPAHRAQKVMPLWGSWGEILFRSDGKRLSVGRPDNLPIGLTRTEYPIDNFRFISQITDRDIESGLPRTIALLLMTCDTYKANQLVLARILPRLAQGAFIVVRGYSPEAARQRHGPLQLLSQVSFTSSYLHGSYWAGISG